MEQRTDEHRSRTGGVADTSNSPHARVRAIGLTDAKWIGGFWGERFARTRDAIVPAMARLMHDEQRFKFVGNFETAAGKGEATRHRGPKWDDGDFYKWIEAAASLLAVAPDPELDRQIDEAVTLIAGAMEPDGYVHTPATIAKRFGNPTPVRFGEPLDFEMYNMGHLITAGCVHHRATGKRNLLDLAIRTADFLDKQFANPTPEVARHGVCPSHLMGLIELARTTGDPKYVETARRLLAMRDLVAKGDDDNQDRVPFPQHEVAHGHAVRATYLYAGAADVYLETGDAATLAPQVKVWDDLVSRKLSITGGCGALYDGASPDGTPDQKVITRTHQSFGRDYQLPNSTAHNETCAAIGNLMWNWRLFLITGEAKYADLVEQTLYNSVLTGVTLDGLRFSYTNTLRQLDPMPTTLRYGGERRHDLSCYCCPPNVARVLAQSAAYAYALDDDGVYVVLYGENTLDTTLPNGTPVKLSQRTAYPWDGVVRITVESAGTFALHLRIPAWADGSSVGVNDDPSEGVRPGAFHTIRRSWSAGDVVELTMPMPPRLVEAHPYVEEARGQVAVVRGPVVYCLESHDLPSDVRLLDVAIRADVELTPTDMADEMAGVVALACRLMARDGGDWTNQLYRDVRATKRRPVESRLIPYFAWGNRGPSEMSVFLPLIG